MYCGQRQRLGIGRLDSDIEGRRYSKVHIDNVHKQKLRNGKGINQRTSRAPRKMRDGAILALSHALPDAPLGRTS